MSAKSLTKKPRSEEERKKTKLVPSSFGVAILYCLWVVIGIGVSQMLVFAFLWTLARIGVPLEAMNSAVLQTTAFAAAYLLTGFIVLGLPWLLRKYRTSKQELGLTRLPSWMDIALAPAGLIVYLPVAALLTLLAQFLITGFEPNQVQQVGFDGISYHFEYLLAFVTLIVIAPVAEEVIFRGYLQGKLRKRLPFWLTAVIVSAIFGLAHGQWNVAVDVFALGLVLSTLREMTGSIWAGILLHMLKNTIAFYYIFVSPLNLL